MRRSHVPAQRLNAARKPAAATPKRADAARARPVGPRNHVLAGAPSDVAGIVEAARSAPAPIGSAAAGIARDFGLTVEALELHAGGAAREACARLGARAFAVQNVVAFAEPQPSPRTIRHEFAHVVQQAGAARPSPARYAPGTLKLGDNAGTAEHEAAAAAHGVAALTPAPIMVQREGDEPDTPTADEELKGLPRARERLQHLAETLDLQELTEAQRETAPFAIAKIVTGAPTAFDPVFLVSSKQTWSLDDYIDRNGIDGTVAAERKKASADFTQYIFRRDTAALAATALAAQALSISSKAGGAPRIVWASRAIAGDVAVTADPDVKTTRYAFVGSYSLAGAMTALAAGSPNIYQIVNERTRPSRTEADPAESLAAYKKIIQEIARVAKTGKPAKKVALVGDDDQIKQIDDAVAVAKLLETEDARAKALDTAASAARDRLKPWVIAQFPIFEELSRIVLDNAAKKLAGTEKVGTETKRYDYTRNWNPIKGDILVLFIDSKKGEGIELKPKQVYFDKDEAKGLKEDAQADGYVQKGTDARILESKAVAGGPGPFELNQMRRYKVIVTQGVPGYLRNEKAEDGFTKIPKLSAVEYYIGLSVPVAELWNAALYKAFKGLPNEDTKPVPKGVGAQVSGYFIHPNVTKDPAKETTIQLNPLLKLPIPNPQEIDQLVADVPGTQPGSKITKADFKLARPLEAEIASGSIVISIDLGGAVQSPAAPAAKPMQPIPDTEAKPLKPGEPIVYGRVENKFDKLGSSLDKFFKERITTDAQLTDTGVTASLTVSKGPSGIPGITLDEAVIAVTYGAKGLTAKGQVGLSNEKGTVKGGITVTWNTAAKQWKVVGTATFTDLVDGLKPIEATLTYDPANDITRIEAKQVGIEKRYAAITLTGTASDLVYDVNAGEFSGDADLLADLGAFGQADAKAKISANRIESATLTYKTPKLSVPKTAPALSGDLTGSITYTAAKTPGGAPSFSGDIGVTAEIQATALKKLAKGGKLGIAGSVHIAESGAFSGKIGTTDALTLGQHFRIPPFQAEIAENGAVVLTFSLEVIEIGALKDAKVDGRIDDKGFAVTGANVQLAFGSDKDRVWGTLGVIYKPGAKDGGLTVGGSINVRIKEGMVAHGKATYDTQKETVSATLSIDEITLLKYGPKTHSLVDFSKQVELISFYQVIGIYLDAGFELAFAYEFDLRLNPTVTLNDFSFKTFRFASAKAVMKLLGQMVATLTGTPKIGLGLFVISTKLLRGGGGIKIPIVGRAALALDPPITIEVVYTPDGGLSAGGTAGLTLTFGVTGSVNPYAEFVVLDGAYEYKWTGADLTSFVLLKERPIFTHVINFGEPLTTETSPKIPSGKDAPATPKTAKPLTGGPQGSAVQTAADTKQPASEQKPDKKPEAKNEGGFDLMGMVSGLLDGASFKPLKSLLDAAGEVWDAISNFVGLIIKFIRNWVGGAIDIITAAIKGIGKKGLIGYIRDLLKERMDPALYYIIEPMLDQLAKVEQDIYDLLDLKLPSGFSGLLEFGVMLIKKVLKLAWDSLAGLVSALKEMITRAIDATRAFAQMLVDKGRLGVMRSERYIGIEGVAEHDFLLADRYKIHFAGLDIEEKDDTAWPSVDKAIGWGLWTLLQALDVKPTSTRVNADTGEAYNDYWMYTIQRQARQGAGLSAAAPRAVRAATAEEAGQPLPAALRHRYAAAFADELADVRIHTGPASAAAATALDARAYTIGRHVHFGAGHYAPGTPAGDDLLAHELAHVAWAPRAARPPGGFAVSTPGDPSERAATAAARASVG